MHVVGKVAQKSPSITRKSWALYMERLGLRSVQWKGTLSLRGSEDPNIAFACNVVKPTINHPRSTIN
jgi:hypothetical protein